MKALGEFLRPEFLNRVDEVICFNKLTEEHFRDIAKIMLGDLKKVLSERDIDLAWDDAVLDALTEKSYSVTYGARNLRRCIQREIEDPVAEKLIDAFENPVTKIQLKAENGEIQILSL